MKITLETDYAIRIVDYLVCIPKMSSALEIAKETVVPLRFAKNILQKLIRTGIVNSYKGVGGGYELGRAAKEISLYDVLEAIEGPLVLNRCLLKGYECTCKPDKECLYYEIFQELSREMEMKMRKIRFSSEVHGQQYGKRDFTVYEEIRA